ncbi:flavodoxin [uncultured Treponema sp.]|uniref:flavodoxin n=1 Tax=uncultured Treponema sp. TaxID=162155 RepID=UPI0025D080E7|nr:flavodoxin [uncultured Treponema sp.]
MKVAIVYATTTGNTEQLANAVAEAAKSAGHELSISTADNADSADTLSADLILLGSPAMGAEQLDDSMETFFSEIEGSLSGKKVGLFGSYDWGEGQWISDWEERVKSARAVFVGSVKAHLSPEDADLEAVKKLIA